MNRLEAEGFRFSFRSTAENEEIMNKFQEQQIRNLRMNGTGYRAIGAAVGLSRDIVRNYCRRHQLAGLGAVLTLNAEDQTGIRCRSCGRKLIQKPRGRKRKFCSDKCRSDWWNRQRSV